MEPTLQNPTEEEIKKAEFWEEIRRIDGRIDELMWTVDKVITALQQIKAKYPALIDQKLIEEKP